MKSTKKPASKGRFKGVQASDNAYALAALGRKLTFATIGARIGQTESSVRHYATGRRVPSELLKLRIHEAYALPLSGWEPSSAGKPLEDGPGSESRAGAGERDKAPSAGLLDRYRRLAETLEAAVSKAQNDRDTPARDVAAIAQALARCLQHIGRLTGEGEITEAMIVKAPAFARVLDMIREVGRRHPDAAREIFEGLSKLGGAS